MAGRRRLLDFDVCALLEPASISGFCHASVCSSCPTPSCLFPSWEFVSHCICFYCSLSLDNGSGVSFMGSIFFSSKTSLYYVLKGISPLFLWRDFNFDFLLVKKPAQLQIWRSRHSQDYLHFATHLCSLQILANFCLGLSN